MEIDSRIFKAYDIRGVFPDEFNEDVAYKVGRAMVVFTNAKKVVIGRDARISSPEIFEAVSKGVMDQGANVVDIGMCTTPMFDFAVGENEDNDAGIMVTASHNPKEYNGLKLVQKDCSTIGKETGMEEIRDMVLRNSFPSSSSVGSKERMDVMEPYVQKVYKFVDIKKIKPLKIVFDVGNGMAGMPLRRILEDLKCEAISLYLEPDGTYPNHPANPMEEKNLEDLKNKIRENNYDLGVAFDGDGDRCRFVDELGNALRGDIVTIILAKKLLEKNPGRAIIYDLISSWSLKEEVLAVGGKPVISKVGHSFIKKLMKEENAIFGGEMSGHYYHNYFYNAESSMLTMLMFLEAISEKNQKLSEIVAPFYKYFHTGEINFEVQDKESKIQQLEEKYSEGAKNILQIDGIKIEFEDWWFSVRASNTEPLLRLNLEAKTKELMEEKREELMQLLEN